MSLIHSCSAYILCTLLDIRLIGDCIRAYELTRLFGHTMYIHWCIPRDQLRRAL